MKSLLEDNHISIHTDSEEPCGAMLYWNRAAVFMRTWTI